MRGCRAGDASGGRAGLEGFEGRASLQRRSLRWSSRPSPPAGSSRSAWSPTRTSCSEDSRTPRRAGGALRDEQFGRIRIAGCTATSSAAPPGRARAPRCARLWHGRGGGDAREQRGLCQGALQRARASLDERLRGAAASAFSMFADDARSRCRRSSAARAPSGARPGQHPAGVRLRPTGRARGDCPPLWTDRADARRRRDRGSHLVHRQRLLRLGAASIAANP
jgi:hypothetical protein